MAIQPQPPPDPNFVTRYVPGTEQFAAMGNLCVEAGDRLIWTGQTYDPHGVFPAPPTVVPDADHLMPHWAYRPAYSRLQPPDAPEVSVTNPLESVGGNNGSTPVIRVDFGPLYCPWAGQVQIEGGAGGFELFITWIWERARRDRLKWWETMTTIIFSGVHGLPRDDVRMPRVPTNQRGFSHQTLTFYNVPGGTRIARPSCAQSVWTPNALTLRLDTGAGSFSSLAVESFGLPVALGPFTFVSPTAQATVLTFGIVF